MDDMTGAEELLVWKADPLTSVVCVLLILSTL